METIADGSPVIQKTATTSKQPILKRQREVDSENDDEPRQFRRVRMKCRQQARNQDCHDKVMSETLLRRGTIRCICGAQDKVTTLEDNSDHSLSTSISSTWLIQCIDCKVWQHRSCVGTANGNDPTSGYYCEQCPTRIPLGLDEDDIAFLQKSMREYEMERTQQLERVRSSRRSAKKPSKATIARKRIKPASMLLK